MNMLIFWVPFFVVVKTELLEFHVLITLIKKKKDRNKICSLLTCLFEAGYHVALADVELALLCKRGWLPIFSDPSASSAEIVGLKHHV